MYVQYGCGFAAPAGWTNFDASFTLKFERTPVIGSLYTKNSQRFPGNVRIGDIVAGLPVAEASCRGVYASHVLEHLPLADFHTALENTKRILQPGGIFRVIVPDLEWSVREYLRRLESGDEKANHYFMESTLLGRQKREKGASGYLFSWLRTSAHQWMWDHTSLQAALRDHGFREIRVARFGDCEDKMFEQVEDPGRFEHAVAFEARR